MTVLSLQVLDNSMGSSWLTNYFYQWHPFLWLCLSFHHHPVFSFTFFHHSLLTLRFFLLLVAFIVLNFFHKFQISLVTIVQTILFVGLTIFLFFIHNAQVDIHHVTSHFVAFLKVQSWLYKLIIFITANMLPQLYMVLGGGFMHQKSQT